MHRTLRVLATGTPRVVLVGSVLLAGCTSVSSRNSPMSPGRPRTRVIYGVLSGRVDLPATTKHSAEVTLTIRQINVVGRGGLRLHVKPGQSFRVRLPVSTYTVSTATNTMHCSRSV